MWVGRGGVFEIHLMLMLEPVLFLQPELVLLELLAPKRCILKWADGGHATWFVVAESVAHLWRERDGVCCLCVCVYELLAGYFECERQRDNKKKRRGERSGGWCECMCMCVCACVCACECIGASGVEVLGWGEGLLALFSLVYFSLYFRSQEGTETGHERQGTRKWNANGDSD